MREIGRLREIAFRAVGEGTDKRRDTDKHDKAYFHLILWDNEAMEIVGAYRLGCAQTLTQNSDGNQLYSASLFEYQPDMVRYFEQGLELGRSFVQPKYWGKRALDYLWMGIGAFIEQNQQYRYLFGPVSLSDAYPEAETTHCEFLSNLFSTKESTWLYQNINWILTKPINGIFR